MQNNRLCIGAAAALVLAASILLSACSSNAAKPIPIPIATSSTPTPHAKPSTIAVTGVTNLKPTDEAVAGLIVNNNTLHNRLLGSLNYTCAPGLESLSINRLTEKDYDGTAIFFSDDSPILSSKTIVIQTMVILKFNGNLYPFIRGLRAMFVHTHSDVAGVGTGDKAVAFDPSILGRTPILTLDTDDFTPAYYIDQVTFCIQP